MPQAKVQSALQPFTSDPKNQPKVCLSGMQKFYKTFSVNNQETLTNKKKSRGISALQKKVEKNSENSEAGLTPIKLNQNAVQKFLSQISVVHVSAKDKIKSTFTEKEKLNFDKHIYENVELTREKQGNKVRVDKNVVCKSISLDSTFEPNVTVIKVQSAQEQANNVRKNSFNDGKLSKALENFDKILSEFSSASQPSSVPFVPPKLQKAKTCSIIESRCILKKSTSHSKSLRDSYSSTESGNQLLDKTKSLWNLSDMEDMHSNSKIPIFTQFANSFETKICSKYSTYRISGKEIVNQVDIAPVNSDEIGKLDVKTRILKKTLSNPPIVPSPVLPTVRPKKVERRTSDPHNKAKSSKHGNNPNKPSSFVKSKTSDHIELSKSKIHKAKSTLELSKSQIGVVKPLSKTKSNTSLSGSSSKIPVVRGQPVSQNKFLSTRALFSATPNDLNSVDQFKDSGSSRTKQLRGQSVSSDSKRNSNKRPERSDTRVLRNNEKNRSTNLARGNSNEFNEISKVRAKIQQKRIAKMTGSLMDSKYSKSEPAIVDVPLSPVKSIISKIEMHNALDSRLEPTPFQNCKTISPPARNLSCKANVAQYTNTNAIPKKKNVVVETRNDSLICQIENEKNLNMDEIKKPLDRTSHEKLYEVHSDCSDDSGHASNESEPSVENILTSPKYGIKLGKLDTGARLNDTSEKDVQMDVYSAKLGIVTPTLKYDQYGVMFKSSVGKLDQFEDNNAELTNHKNLTAEEYVNKSDVDEVDLRTAGIRPDLIRDVGFPVTNHISPVFTESPQSSHFKFLERVPEIPVPAERKLQVVKNPEPQVLLRAGAVSSLESRRDALLRARVVSLQALCRGVLARRAAARRRVQVVAARCVQRNVRAFLAVRDWPWWRLLVRVAPLLAVNRTEDQLRAKTEELETLKSKAEKLELERSALKHENDKLENKLSEMTAELAVEQSAGALAAERLSAETSERLRLERDIHTLKASNTALQQTSERLETELMFSRAEGGSEAGGGGSEEEGSEGGGGGSKYKRRLQAALRELDAARRQLRQQHEDDLEQLVTLKKQLEKKVADAYEEVNEQRQVAAQWKRKAQKAGSDANDLRLLLDEQGARAALLEKKQRRWDGEGQQLQEEVRRERQLRERRERELDLLQQEKHQLEQTLADTRMELETKEEKLSEVQRELQEVVYGGGVGGEEMGALRKAKHDLEIKCHDQEEELDEMAGQLQLLESHKVRLEMSLEQQRKSARLEAAQRDEELEEVRAQTAKKLKGLESQLESEHSERTLLLRERHELERRLAALEESARAEAQERDAREQRARRDLRRARALARDAQAVMERREKEAPGKQQIRQLRDKLDDMEVSLRAAVKARQAAEAEASDASAALEEAQRGRREAEGRAVQAQRDATSAQAQLEEAEEEAAQVMKKYRNCVSTLSEEQRMCREASARAAAAEEEARSAQERVSELQARLASLDMAHNAGQAAQHDKLELRSKELEARLELEQTARTRLEAQATRAREAAAASAQAAGAAQAREQQQAEELRKVLRQIRELREELSCVQSRLEDAVRARGEAETRLEAERAESASVRVELREARARIQLLQQAITDELSQDNNSDSDNDSYSSDESIDTFLANLKGNNGISLTGNHSPKSNEGRQSRSSVSSSKQLSPTKESFA